MTNQLDVSVEVQNSDDLDGLKKYQKIRYICKKCGKPVERLYIGSRRKLIERFLCQECNYKQTCKERFGSENAMQNEKVKQKLFDTNVERYGNKCSLRNEDVYNKAKNTWKEKYGVINPFSTEDSKDKARKSQARKRFFYNDGEAFDSSWELAFWIYHKDNGVPIKREPTKMYFIYEGTKLGYVPDFEVGGQLYEIKGDQFFDKDGNMVCPYNHTLDKLWKAKQDFMVSLGVKIIRRDNIQNYIEYVNKNYGNNYLFSFCQKKKKLKSPNTRQPRKCKCLESGVIFNNMGEAARSINVSMESIRSNCVGKTRSCKGLHFIFV